MSSHQSNKDKPRASKCHHFCHSFNVHNYCPTCREVGKGDDPCVTLLSPCNICTSFTEEQHTKITHRKRYIKRGDKKSEKSDKNDDLDAELLGDNSIESFGGSHAELEVAAERLFTSPPRPQPLSFEALPLRTPARTVPPTPGLTSSASDLYSDPSDDPQPASSRPKKHSDKSKHKSRSRFLPSSSGEDRSPERRHRSPKPSRKSYPDQEHLQHDPDPPYYREVALSDIPSQYAEEVDTFRRILRLPDPRESLPRSSTVVMGLDDEKGRKKLRPRGPSSMLPLNSIIKDAFDKFDQDFQAANLPEGKTSKPLPPLPSGTR